MRGGDYTVAERLVLVDYCTSDVLALGRLLPAMLPSILNRRGGPGVALGQAMLRGRFMAAAARMEHMGIPTDATSLASIRASWSGIKGRLIREVDARYGCFEGTVFKAARFANYLTATGIPWPRLESGALQLDDDTFRDQAKSWPQLQPLRELRHALGELRLERLAVGSDNRNRCLLSAFSSKTGLPEAGTELCSQPTMCRLETCTATALKCAMFDCFATASSGCRAASCSTSTTPRIAFTAASSWPCSMPTTTAAASCRSMSTRPLLASRSR